MRRRLAPYWIGVLIAFGLGSWMACDNGGPSTVPDGPEIPPASPVVDAPTTTPGRVAETAALTDSTPPIPPWHDCLHDDGGDWQVDDGRRCAPIQAHSTITGWSRRCAHNRAYFAVPDYRCCVDDGTGQCVPGSETSLTGSPEETGPEGTGPEEEGPEEEEPEEEEPQDEEPTGPRVWIYDTSPRDDQQLCEGDFIAAIGIRRSDSAGELEGSVYLVDPELAEQEETGLPGGYEPIQGDFGFADGDDSITVFSLDQKRIERCPKCSELRSVRLGISPQLFIDDDNDPDKSYDIGDELVFRIRKATHELCVPKQGTLPS